MIYFAKNIDTIDKYNVTFDRIKVEDLKNEIIDNCSYIKHVEYESDYGPLFGNGKRIIENFNAFQVGTKEYFEETRTIYKYSFDEYFPPRLVDYIDSLLKFKSSALNNILNYDLSKDNTSIDNKIDKANAEFMNTNVDNIEKRKEILDEIEELLKEKELNKNQKELLPYYKKLLKLIHISLVDSLDISELERIESFFETKIDTKINDTNKKKEKIKE